METRGGKRLNAGRKKMYKEKTKVIAFRVPKDHAIAIKSMVKKYLDECKLIQK